MPFSRPTLSELRQQVMSDINSSTTGANSFLRKAVLYVLAIAQAGLAYLHYGYLDWIAQQAVPWTATDEYAAAWGALKNVYQKAATPAKLAVQFVGTVAVPIDAELIVTRSDGVSYTILETVEIGADGTASVTVQATVAGTNGNCDIGTPLTLSTTVEGINSTGSVTGTVETASDIESQTDFSARIMSAYQASPQGGASNDYVEWAEGIAGVTRAWCSPVGFGAGTVVVYFMMDDAEEANSGFPQGTDGVSQYDQGPNLLPRGVVATGDQLTVADAIIDQQPATALVYAVSPIPNRLDLTISGLSSASTDTRAAISAAVSDVLLRDGDPRAGTIDRNEIEAAINSVSGTNGWLMVSITGTVNGVVTTYQGNITSGIGELPVLNSITYS